MCVFHSAKTCQRAELGLATYSRYACLALAASFLHLQCKSSGFSIFGGQTPPKYYLLGVFQTGEVAVDKEKYSYASKGREKHADGK